MVGHVSQPSDTVGGVYPRTEGAHGLFDAEGKRQLGAPLVSGLEVADVLSLGHQIHHPQNPAIELPLLDLFVGTGPGHDPAGGDGFGVGVRGDRRAVFCEREPGEHPGCGHAGGGLLRPKAGRGARQHPAVGRRPHDLVMRP